MRRSHEDANSLITISLGMIVFCLAAPIARNGSYLAWALMLLGVGVVLTGVWMRTRLR